MNYSRNSQKSPGTWNIRNVNMPPMRNAKIIPHLNPFLAESQSLGVSGSLTSGMARSAGASALVPSGIGFIKGMAVLAMSFGALFGSVSLASKFKTAKIIMFVFGQNLFFIPSQIHSLINSLVRNIKQVAPFRSRFSHAIISYMSILARIILLFFARCPSAIRFFIVSVIIRPAVNGIALGALSHILQKSLKAINPLIAYLNTPAAIFCKMFGIWVIASGFHIAPRLVSRTSGEPSFGVGLVEYMRAGSRFLISETSARLNKPRAHMASPYLFGCPAITSTKPIAGFLGFSNNYKPIKSAVSKINKCWHGIYSLLVYIHCNIHETMIISRRNGYAFQR